MSRNIGSREMEKAFFGDEQRVAEGFERASLQRCRNQNQPRRL
jgi:hypothetical protein